MRICRVIALFLAAALWESRRQSRALGLRVGAAGLAHAVRLRIVAHALEEEDQEGEPGHLFAFGGACASTKGASGLRG